MFVFFTPYTYLFVSLYFMVMSSMFSISNIFFYWLFMEILMLLFMGISYTVFLHSYAQLMLYFLFQTLASFSLLVFYILSYKYLLFISLFMKLGTFPFFSWYINVLYRFPTFILFLASTMHKLPPLFILYILFEYQFMTFVLLFCILTVFLASVHMFYIKDLRYLMIVSSMGNNSFMILAAMTNNVIFFLVFYTLYMLNMLLIFSSFNNLSSHATHLSLPSPQTTLYLLFLLLNLGAYPPLPPFFSKFLVFLSCLSLYPQSAYLFMILMILNVLMMVSYLVAFFKYIVNVYSNSTNILIY